MSSLYRVNPSSGPYLPSWWRLIPTVSQSGRFRSCSSRGSIHLCEKCNVATTPIHTSPIHPAPSTADLLPLVAHLAHGRDTPGAATGHERGSVTQAFLA